MKNAYRISLSAAIVLVLAAAAGCRRQEVPQEEEGYGFGYELRITHGVRNDASVVRLPQVTFTITEGDEAADYSLYFTVNGRDGRTVRNIWLGAERDLSSFFSSCTDYGTYLIQGEVYRTDGLGEVVPFEEPVYMQGEAVESMAASFTVGREERALSDGPVTFYVSEQGAVTASYAPATAHVVPEVSWEGDRVLDFDLGSAVVSGGSASVPFTVTRSGEGTLTFTLRSGESERSFVQRVAAVADASHDYSFDVSVLAPASAPSGRTLSVKTSLSAGDAKASYDVSYLVDGKEAASDRRATLPVTKAVPVGTALGAHTLRVTVTRSDGMGSAVSREVPFTVTGVPVSGVTVTAGSATASAGQTLRLQDPSSVRLTVTPVPSDALVNSVRVSSADASVLAVSPSGTGWTVSSGSGVFGRTTLRVSVSGVGEYSFDIPVEVSHVVNVRVDEETQPGGAPLFRATLLDDAVRTTRTAVRGTAVKRYHGECDVYEASGDRLHPAERTVHRTLDVRTVTEEFTWDLQSSASAVVCDFAAEAAEVGSLTEPSSWWDDANPAGEFEVMRGEVPYGFVFDSASVTLALSVAGSAGDLVSLRVTNGAPGRISVK